MVLAAVMAVAVMGVFLTQMQDDGSREVDYVFAQTANGGSYADGVLTLDGVSTTVIALLGPPSISGQAISYTIDVVAGSIPPAFGPASLFIDTEEEDLPGDDEP